MYAYSVVQVSESFIILFHHEECLFNNFQCHQHCILLVLQTVYVDDSLKNTAEFSARLTLLEMQIGLDMGKIALTDQIQD